jgi:hypothetical protein
MGVRKRRRAASSRSAERRGDEIANSRVGILLGLDGFQPGVERRRGYARALESFDVMLGQLLAALGPADLLVITADHGNDPTWTGWNHTREHVPVIFAGPPVTPVALGRRESFADIGQSLAGWFGLPPLAHVRAFLPVPTPAACGLGSAA